MDDNQWVWPERRDFYHACAALAEPQADTAQISAAVDTLLDDLELYDDPHQGRGIWLFSNELPIADGLATKLHALAGGQTSEDWGHAIIGHSSWPDIRADAVKLYRLISINGQGSASDVR